MQDIFGLGLAQVLVWGAFFTGAGVVAGVGAARGDRRGDGARPLASTAIVLQILDERGKTTRPMGKRSSRSS